MTCRTAQQSAEYISSSLVGWHDTIRQHKRTGTDMVCDDTDGHILLGVTLIWGIGQFPYMLGQCF